jgi:hypothetical protein
VFVGLSRLGKGAHVELGLALGGRASRIVLIGVEPMDSVFYTPGVVEVVPDVVAALQLLLGK